MESKYFTNTLSRYSLVLVCGPRNFSISDYVPDFPQTKQSSAPLAPFFIGCHEVTNRNFAEFLNDHSAQDWRTNRVTKAGSGASIPPSPYCDYTNEYHLYEWSEAENSERREFQPRLEILDHPVVWVSWFAAAAYCNWLSSREGRKQEYESLILGEQSSDLPGYRLPLCKEWFFTAQGGYRDIEYPWEHVPLPIAGNGFEKAIESLDMQEFTDESLGDRLLHYRKIVEDEMLRTERKGTSIVLEDQFGPFGTSGMLGNVKEWTHENEQSPEGADDINKKMIMGATAYIGKESFSFKYSNSLFPQNTNPDLGFRIARELSQQELQIINC